MSDFTSDFWNLYVAGLVLVSIIACLILLWIAGTTKAATVHDNTTGHVWDGDLREINNPLPKWWVYLFIITCVFGLAYGALYPMFGKFQGVLGWSSQGQHTAEVEKVEAAIAPIYAKFQGMKPEDMAGDAQAMAIGERLFMNYCAQCHGSDARGAKGFPNLTDGDWLWGGTPEQILATIVDGRQAAMPALGAAIGGDVGVTEVAAYVQSLSGIKADPALAEAGKTKYAGVCAACHGADGKGNPILGAPNLTDDTWLYGSDFATISEGIRNGRGGMMPAHGPIIGETRSRLVGAYVWTISHGKDAEPPDAP